MLQFETLLLRQLQKQQNRDELCDTVLHTQGVSVPVHSCVLSAFSPRFFGALSSMPVPMAGQRRLIELQAVDGCTLLSLVSLLYSGQLPENREQVLSAAQTLGIELPQWQEEERHGEKEGRNKVREDADQEKEVDAQEWKTEKGSRREKEKTIESGTQTGCGKKTDEGGTQADLGSSKPQTMYLIHPSTCPASQELGSCVDIQNVALPLQVIHPERKSMTCDPSAMAPVTESAYLSRIYLCSLETSHQQTSTSVSLPPHNSFLDQSMVVPAARAAAINDLKQFEGNIPGFINYFLDSTDSANKGRRGQGCAREGAKEEQVVKSAKARSTARDSGREWIRWTGGERRQRRMERWGLVARLAWRGQGGGRVGRPLESRSTGKNQMRAFQRRQVREARGRGRCRQRGKTGTVAGREKQNDLPCKRRSRSHPRVRPLPPASRSLSTITTTMQNTVDPTGLDLLHTMTPVPVNQIEPIQPIDALLEDIITGLHFLPQAENQYSQHGLMSTTTSCGPPISKASYSKPTDPKPHMEGELSDMLDHILSTFDQQVGCCGLDVGGETSQGSNKPDSGTDRCSNTSKTFTQLQPYNPHINNQKPQANYLHTSSTLSTQPQSMVNPSVAKKNNVQDGQKRQSKQKKPSRDQNIVQKFENRRLTRSQTMKRKLETALIAPQNAVKKKCNEKESADTKKKRQRDDRKRPKCKARVNKSGVKKWDKNNKKMAPQVCSKESQKQVRASERKRRKNRFGRNKTSVKNNSHGMDGFKKKKKKKKKKSSPQKERHGNNGCRGNVRGYRVEAERKSNGFLAGGSSVKRQIERPYITRASSAMKKVKMLLQLQDEKEDGRARENLGIYWRKNEENGRLVKHQRLSGAQERFPVENSLEENQAAKDKGRINGKEMVKGQERKNSIVEVRPRREDRRTADGTKQEEMATDRSSVPFQLNLPSDTAKEGIKNTTASAGTTESVRKVFDSCPGDPVSAPGVRLLQSDVVLASTQSTMHRTTDLALNVGDAPRLSFASRLSHTRPFQELLSPHTSTKDSQQLSGSCVDEEDDVDVVEVEVSSPTSELPAVSILEVDLSTEDEVEEDFEIDVLGPD